MEKINTIQELNKELLSIINKKANLKDYDLKEYSDLLLYKVEDKLKENFINNCIKKYNILNLDYYTLQNKINKELKNTIIFNFEDIEQQIKAYFGGFSKEDRIKEIKPYFNIEKHFNKDKQKYFSLWDLSRKYYLFDDEGRKNGVNLDKLKTDVENTINPLKEICFNFWLSNYHWENKEIINKIVEWVNLAFNCDLKQLETIYKDDKNNISKTLKEIQEEINTKEVKFKFFNKFFYLSFTDNEKQQKLKELVKEETIKRLSRD